MKISRTEQLYLESGTAHSFWRCHNKEFYLANPSNKTLYLDCVVKGLEHKSVGKNVQMHAYCVMGNHFHQLVSYQESSSFLSNYFRVAHTHFGMKYNSRNKRCGKVAQARPKTPLIENYEHQMRVHFYIEANPIRSKICKLENLRNFKYSSFGFYAFGLQDKYSKFLTPPDWYLSLGSTPKERQKKYRALFRRYVEKESSETSKYLDVFIGSQVWIIHQKKRVKESRFHNTQENIDST